MLKVTYIDENNFDKLHLLCKKLQILAKEVDIPIVISCHAKESLKNNDAINAFTNNELNHSNHIIHIKEPTNDTNNYKIKVLKSRDGSLTDANIN